MLIRDVAGRRYALALGEIASENDSFENWANLLNDASVIYQDVQSEALFTSNELSDDEFVSILQDVFTNLDELSINFFRLLKKKNRLNLLPSIASYFQEILDDNSNVVRGEVIAAVPIDNDLSDIENSLSKKLNKKVILSSTIDENIIAGIKIRIGDRLFDGTVKSKLNKLKEDLLNVQN
jgi:F-type H+-transporting ATPase subunit delta